jgi:1-acyl-sn-glycerol-3-phosphate acyltransferase
MNSDGADKPEVAKWDPGFTRQIKNWVGPVIKRYFRAEVRGLDSMPAAGGALVVSNHSGGMFTPDVLVFAPAFYDKFGFDRPVYTLDSLQGVHRAALRVGCAAPV